MADKKWKGGFDRVSWMGRYAERFLLIGWTESEALEAAIAAWDASPHDADPDETAADDMAYMAEDRE